MVQPYLKPIDLAGNELRRAKIYNLAADPVNPSQGWIYFNTTSALMKYHNGTSWVTLNSSTDSQTVNGLDSTYLLSRSNHTGTQLTSTISDFIDQVRANRLDQFAYPTTQVWFNNQKLAGIAAPVFGTDAANKTYVDTTDIALQSQVSSLSSDIVAKAPKPHVTVITGTHVLSDESVVLIDSATDCDVFLPAGIDHTIYRIRNIGAGRITFRANGINMVELNSIYTLLTMNAFDLIFYGNNWYIL